MRFSARALAAGLCGLCAGACHAWGEEGHSIVAEIAQRRLGPEAGAAVVRLLGPGVSLASVASWADDVRGARPATARWHFVDMPRERNVYSEAEDCASEAGGDCAVKELGRLKHDLRCAPSDDARREALKFAVHFVGDIHQPLHAAKEDTGGNAFPVKGTLHAPTCSKNGCDVAAQYANLHQVWDTGLIRWTVFDWGAYVERLENGWLKTEAFQGSVVSEQPADWAMQTHAVSRMVWQDILPPDGTLTDAYYGTVLPVLDQQLALGGVRLARFLDDAFGSTNCSGTDDRVLPVAVGSETGIPAAANLGELKKLLADYHDHVVSGGFTQYQLDQQRTTEAASAYVLQRAKAATRPALVLDIDETSLDNYAQMAANDYGYIPLSPCPMEGGAIAKGQGCGNQAWDRLAQAPAIAATLKLFNAAKAAGVAVFFITGRGEDERDATMKALHAAGYDGWAGLVLKPASWVSRPPVSVANYKATERARLVLHGYTVLASVGDQPSDLAGGYAERFFLMPNPYYRLP
jgi:hypothetical protein